MVGLRFNGPCVLLVRQRPKGLLAGDKPVRTHRCLFRYQTNIAGRRLMSVDVHHHVLRTHVLVVLAPQCQTRPLTEVLTQPAGNLAT